jgi:glycerol-3-phosphate dehydrogenase
MAARELDVLVIGGGITGAGVARDAALRGWRVALVEQTDFGAGTSSRSSKIVHGGVRYLEYGQFALVRESARERRVLQSIAPHLVHRLDFLYPVFAPDWLLKVRVRGIADGGPGFSFPVWIWNGTRYAPAGREVSDTELSEMEATWVP